MAAVVIFSSAYYHADGLGSIVAMTDDQARNVQQYEYDSFGNQHDMKNRIKQPYGYTGREHDRETGLRYYRARYYDGEVGVFLSKDPISFMSGSTNLYSYVGNDPVNWIDPWGYVEVCTSPIAGNEKALHSSIKTDQGQYGLYPKEQDIMFDQGKINTEDKRPDETCKEIDVPDSMQQSFDENVQSLIDEHVADPPYYSVPLGNSGIPGVHHCQSWTNSVITKAFVKSVLGL